MLRQENDTLQSRVLIYLKPFFRFQMPKETNVSGILQECLDYWQKYFFMIVDHCTR